MTRRPLLLLSLCLALSAVHCHRPLRPARLPIAVAQPVAVPVPPPPSDPTLLGYIKLRDPGQLVSRVGGLLGALAAAQSGINLGEIRPGASAAVFLWEPQALDLSRLPVAALLPIPVGGSLARSLAGAFPKSQAIAAGEGTLAGLNRDALVRASAQLQLLGALAQAPTPFDGLLYLHIAPLVAKYGPTARASLAALGPLLAAQSQGGKGKDVDPQAVVRMAEKLLDRVDTLRSYTLGVTQLAESVELATIIEDKPEAQSAPGGPIAAPDLGRFLPPGDVRLQWNLRDARRTFGQYLSLYAPLLATRPGLQAALEEALADWTQASPTMEIAETLSFDATRGLRLVAILRSSDGAAMKAAMQRMVQRFSQGPIHEAYLGLGMDLSIEHQPATRKVLGWPVDRYTYHLKMLKEPPDAVSKAILARFANLPYEVMQLGPYLLMSFDDPATLDALAESLGRGRPGAPLAATRAYPPGGSFYCDLDIARLIEGLRGALPSQQAAKLPMLPPDLAPLTLYAYDGGNVGYYRLQMPKRLLSTLLGSLGIPVP